MIIFILVLAFVLRILLIDQSFWLDEVSQAMTSMRPLADIVFNNLADFHPPFSYLLTHFWIQFSSYEGWLRLLPVSFGVGTVYLIYILGKYLFNEKVGLLAALLLALAPYHIYYSQEFRMYSMATFFAIWSMYAFIRILQSSHKIRFPHFEREDLYIWSFMISSSLLMYTHYLGAVLLLSQLLYITVFEKKWLKQFLIYYLIVSGMFLPWIPFLFAQLQVGLNADAVLPGWSTMLSLTYYKAIPLLFTKFIIGRIDFDNNLIYLSIVCISFLIVGFALYPLIKKIKDKTITNIKETSDD